ncbi:hypothetical protein NX801_28840 [Streptomyces sp. LP05-1]|uniref:Secreted protein n=1 Tax=Streptomyces pyxinae TaxID=2970734 RepID=A0ABT2CS98_9ACTN|nr:hypothetical protein [Streptomyces sp. LP05-1]MCS0639571.1 hypothetical protein [Streptomyces sp. LP05-1]
MITKVLATAGLAAAVLGAAAPLAAADGDRQVHTQNGNYSSQSYGNTGAGGAEQRDRSADEAALRSLTDW